MNLKAGEIIGKLMSMGFMVTINQSIDADTAELLAEEYNCKVHRVSLYEETVIESEKGDESGIDVRSPIVTVMGHAMLMLRKARPAALPRRLVHTEFPRRRETSPSWILLDTKRLL